MTPEEIDRALARDAAGVRASPTFAAAVMAAVHGAANAPPPLAFPWLRAVPGIAAGVLALVLATALLWSTPSADTATSASPALQRAVELAATVSNALATVDARQTSIWLIVAALTVVPILAPLMLVRTVRGS